jgi:hypothetical protein
MTELACKHHEASRVVTTAVSHGLLLAKAFYSKIAILIPAGPAPAAVWPAGPIAVRGVFGRLHALQARPAPAWPQTHCPAEAPDVTGCRGISCSGHVPGQLGVVRVSPPSSGVGATVSRQALPGKPPRRRTDSPSHHLFWVETS